VCVSVLVLKSTFSPAMHSRASTTEEAARAPVGVASTTFEARVPESSKHIAAAGSQAMAPSALMVDGLQLPKQRPKADEEAPY
jgi:hypothetical protein